MKIILAPDSFKKSMNSMEVCVAMENGIKKVNENMEIVKIPMANGEENALEAMISATSGIICKELVKGPLGIKVNASYGIIREKNVGIVEISEICGLKLIPKEKRNPMKTTTYGVGEIIKILLDEGVKKIIIGLEGSATNDGGVGLLTALGAKFYDRFLNELPLGAEGLKDLEKIDLSGLDKRLLETEILIACDVKNTLTGILGASYIFGPQKGADREMVQELDRGLKKLSIVVSRDLGKDIENIEGGGAAGGLGSTLVGFLNGKLVNSVDLMLNEMDFKEKIKGADYIFVGEGKIDYQTKYRKSISGIAKIAKNENIKVVCFTGIIGTKIEDLYEMGLTAIFPISNGELDLEHALKNGPENLQNVVESVCRVLPCN